MVVSISQQVSSFGRIINEDRQLSTSVMKRLMAMKTMEHNSSLGLGSSRETRREAAQVNEVIFWVLDERLHERRWQTLGDKEV
jgi:predicted membrane chloride channel (bestrophin family)